MRFHIASFFSRSALPLIVAATIFLVSFADASGFAVPSSVFSLPADPVLLAADDIFSNDQGPGISAADPLLTIIYDAATYGELYPCPT